MYSQFVMHGQKNIKLKIFVGLQYTFVPKVTELTFWSRNFTFKF